MSLNTPIKPGRYYFTQLYEFVKTLQLPLLPDERRIHENVGKWRRPPPQVRDRQVALMLEFVAVDGMMLLTNHRVIFYSVDVYKYPSGFHILVELPLTAIKSLSYKEFGRGDHLYPIVAVEADPAQVRGETHLEFVLINAGAWIRHLESMIKERRAEMLMSPHSPSKGKEKDISKVCLNCMSVIPESSANCPKCGYKF